MARCRRSRHNPARTEGEDWCEGRRRRGRGMGSFSRGSQLVACAGLLHLIPVSWIPVGRFNGHSDAKGSFPRLGWRDRGCAASCRWATPLRDWPASHARSMSSTRHLWLGWRIGIKADCNTDDERDARRGGLKHCEQLERYTCHVTTRVGVISLDNSQTRYYSAGLWLCLGSAKVPRLGVDAWHLGSRLVSVIV